MRLSCGDCRVSWVWELSPRRKREECHPGGRRPGAGKGAGVDCLVFSTVSSRWHAMLDARWVLDTRAIAPARDTGDCEAAEQSESPPERERHERTRRTPLKNRGHAANRATWPAVRRKDPRQPPPPAARMYRLDYP